MGAPDALIRYDTESITNHRLCWNDLPKEKCLGYLASLSGHSGANAISHFSSSQMKWPYKLKCLSFQSLSCLM
jgi:hypothetical protein